MVGGHPQPLAAFYASELRWRRCARVLGGEGNTSLRALLEKLDVRYVSEADVARVRSATAQFF